MVRVIFYERNGEIILLHAFYKRDRKDTEKALEVALKILNSITDENGDVKELLPRPATTKDYIYLAIACIVAAAAMKDEEAPDLTKDILYKATSEEIKLLVKTVVELRMEWYHIPTTATIDKMKEDGEKKEKNVDQPAIFTKQS